MSQVCDFCVWSGGSILNPVMVKFEVIAKPDSDRFVAFMRYFKTSSPELCQAHYNKIMREFAFSPGDTTKFEFLNRD